MVIAFVMPKWVLAGSDENGTLAGQWVAGKGECLATGIGAEAAQRIALFKAKEDIVRKVLSGGESESIVSINASKIVEKSNPDNLSVTISALYAELIIHEDKPQWNLIKYQPSRDRPAEAIHTVSMRAKVVKGAEGDKALGILNALKDTIWRPLPPLGATLISTAAPGVGQILNRRQSGYIFLPTGLISLLGVGLTQLSLEKSLNDRDNALKKSDYEELSKKVQSKRENRNMSLVILGVVWTVNLIDAYLESLNEYNNYRKMVRHLGEGIIDNGIITTDRATIKFMSEGDGFLYRLGCIF